MFDFLKRKKPAPPEPKKKTPKPVVLSPLAAAANSFALDLWRKGAAPGNFLVSPGSLWLALAMTASGAKGETQAELAKLLRLPVSAELIKQQLERWIARDEELGLTLNVVNRLFGDLRMKFEEPWMVATEATFGAALERLTIGEDPEGARAHINSWVAGQTNERIKELLPERSIEKLTRLVLVNAVHFLAKWQTKFVDTLPRPFHFAPGVKKDVPTMVRLSRFRYAEVEGAQVIELPYQGSPVHMIVVLPTALDGLSAIEESLSAERVESWVSAMEDTSVLVSLPSFEIAPASSLALRETLEEMGTKLPFDRERAEFTEIAKHTRPEDRLVVSNVFHQAFIRVDEEGTEAAAATAVTMTLAGSAPPREPEEPRIFNADHPFLFFLRDEVTGVWLFQGRVVSP
jgi:serpin B